MFTAAVSPVIGEKGMKEEGSPSGMAKVKKKITYVNILISFGNMGPQRDSAAFHKGAHSVSVFVFSVLVGDVRWMRHFTVELLLWAK